MNSQSNSLVKRKKVKIEIDGEIFEIPQIVLDEFKKQEEGLMVANEVIDNLKFYIYMHTGNYAKAWALRDTKHYSI